jgi:hypothetical protein
MSNKLYSTDGSGRWWVSEWQPQCDHDILFSGECQGTKGHEGDHWRYMADGSYHWRREGAGGGWTPPGHASWISPVDKLNDHHSRFSSSAEVTDPELIAKLEAGEVDDPITAPCSDDEVEELRRLGRLDE